MTRLYLIRHGEAVGAVEHRIADQGEHCGLTPLGQTQARRLRDRLAATQEIAADVLIASTFPRAHETAEIIAPALGCGTRFCKRASTGGYSESGQARSAKTCAAPPALGGLPIIPDAEVQEQRTGEADGLPYAEMQARYGRPDYDRDPFRPIAPGGESWAQFKLRAAQALYRITHQYAGQSVVVVCHGGVIDSTFLYFFGLGPYARPRAGFYTHNTSITEWVQHDPGDTRRWHLMRYNDDFHLRGHVHWEGITPQPQTGADQPSVPQAPAVPG